MLESISMCSNKNPLKNGSLAFYVVVVSFGNVRGKGVAFCGGRENNVDGEGKMEKRGGGREGNGMKAVGVDEGVVGMNSVALDFMFDDLSRSGPDCKFSCRTTL